jgi:hypothetical protein
MVNKGDELPSSEAFDKISLRNFLVIESNEKKVYQREGVYSLGVQFIQHDSSEDIDEHTLI